MVTIDFGKLLVDAAWFAHFGNVSCPASDTIVHHVTWNARGIAHKEEELHSAELLTVLRCSTISASREWSVG
jgi:hypothetical protein